MNIIQKITANISILLISQILNQLAVLFIGLYTARFLGAQGYGTLAFATAFVTTIGVVTDLGLHQLMIREIARDFNLTSKYLGNIITIRLILACILIVIILIGAKLLNYSENIVIIVLITTISYIINVFTYMIYSVYQAFEKMHFIAVGLLLNGIIYTIGILFAIFSDLNLIGFALIVLVTNMIVFIYNLRTVFNSFPKISIKHDIQFIIQILKESIPFGITGMSVTIYMSISAIFLSFFTNNQEVGWFIIDFKLLTAFWVIPYAFSTAIYPLMSRYYINSPNLLVIITVKYFKYLLLFAFPICIFITLNAPDIILFLMGQDFLQSIIGLQILIWSLILLFSRSTLERLFISVNKQVIVTKAYIIGVIVEILLNVFFIIVYQFIGAIIAFLLTDLVILLLLVYWCNELEFRISISDLLVILSKLFFASILSILILLYLNNFINNIFISSGLLIITYSLVLIITKYFDSYDILLIRKILKII